MDMKLDPILEVSIYMYSTACFLVMMLTLCPFMFVGQRILIMDITVLSLSALILTDFKFKRNLSSVQRNMSLYNHS